MDRLTVRDMDRAIHLEDLGNKRTGAENNELQVLWLRQWLDMQTRIILGADAPS